MSLSSALLIGCQSGVSTPSHCMNNNSTCSGLSSGSITLPVTATTSKIVASALSMAKAAAPLVKTIQTATTAVPQTLSATSQAVTGSGTSGSGTSENTTQNCPSGGLLGVSVCVDTPILGVGLGL